MGNIKINQLDITNEHCPMTFVKVKLALEKMETKEQLEVLLAEGEPLDNVPKTVKEQGNRVLEITQVKNNIYRVLIEKC
ncbi:MAG: sulfurtransferase TusA family protein [Actinobacteria bacterium]|nr:sulfurtransferase TusA family protein [Actinomycetota bacterium]